MVAADLNADGRFDLIVVNHSGCRPADCDLSAGGQLLASRKIDDGGRCGQGATVYALEESFMREFAEIAANGVFREAQLAADVLGDDLAVFFKLFEDELFALSG